MTINVRFLTAVMCLGFVRLTAQTRPQPDSNGAKRGALETIRSAAVRNSLDDFSQTVQNLIRDVSPAVVAVEVQSFGRPESDTSGNATALGRQTREGTGVLVSADGYVITNAHVVQSAQRVQIRVEETAAEADPVGGPRRSVTADIVGIDQETDLAVLKIPGAKWNYLPFADSAQLRKGEVVFAVGSPQGLENSVSMGIVSAAERQLGLDSSQVFIQTDAPINPGNSGGPLVNAHGEIAGINTFIITTSGGSEGLGFAIPSNVVKDVYSQITRYGHVRRGEMGVIARTVTPALAKALSLPSESGVLIQDVLDGKSAAAAGLQIDDVVVRVEGRPVANLRQLANNLFHSEIGGKLSLEVLRKDRRLELQVELQEPSPANEAILERTKERAVPISRLGILAVTLNQETAPLITEPKHQYGAIVAAKLQTARVFQEELEPGDVIFGINGQAAASVEALTAIATGVPGGSPLVVQVQRQGVLRYVVLHNE